MFARQVSLPKNATARPCGIISTSGARIASGMLSSTNFAVPTTEMVGFASTSTASSRFTLSIVTPSASGFSVSGVSVSGFSVSGVSVSGSSFLPNSSRYAVTKSLTVSFISSLMLSFSASVAFSSTVGRLSRTFSTGKLFVYIWNTIDVVLPALSVATSVYVSSTPQSSWKAGSTTLPFKVTCSRFVSDTSMFKSSAQYPLLLMPEILGAVTSNITPFELRYVTLPALSVNLAYTTVCAASSAAIVKFFVYAAQSLLSTNASNSASVFAVLAS